MQYRYMLDTNMATYIATGRSPAAVRRMEQVDIAQVVVSAITQGELLFGFAKRTGAFRARTMLEDFLTPVDIVAWDSAAALTYGGLRSALTQRGITISALDLLIAAHALALGATLVTHDRALHRLAPYLPVEDWATDI